MALGTRFACRPRRRLAVGAGGQVGDVGQHFADGLYDEPVHGGVAKAVARLRVEPQGCGQCGCARRAIALGENAYRNPVGAITGYHVRIIEAGVAQRRGGVGGPRRIGLDDLHPVAEPRAAVAGLGARRQTGGFEVRTGRGNRVVAGERPAIGTVEEGLTVQRVIDGIYRAAEAGTSVSID